MPFFHGTKTLICHAPSHAPGTVEVRVCNDPNRWSETAATYTYNAEPTPNLRNETVNVPNFPGLTNSQSNTGGSYLAQSTSSDQFSFAEMLNLNVIDSQGYAPLHYMASYGIIENLQKVLHYSLNLFITDKRGNTPLHWAVKYNQLEFVKQLLKLAHLENVNSLNEDGDSPLHWAALNGNREIIMELVLKGANINQQNFKGFTSLQLAISNSHFDVAQWLLQVGANPNIPSSNGLTALHLAVLSSQIVLVKLLMNNASHVNLQDHDGETSLHWAVRMDQQEIVKQLLSSGAIPNIKNSDGETPLSLASELNHQSLVSLLVTYAVENLKITRSSFPKKLKKCAQKVIKSHSKYCPSMRRFTLSPLEKALALAGKCM